MRLTLAILGRLYSATLMLGIIACGNSDAVTEPSSPEAEALIVSPAVATIELQETVQLVATVGQTVLAGIVWSTDNPTVATVTIDGLVTGVNPGEGRRPKISARTEGTSHA